MSEQPKNQEPTIPGGSAGRRKQAVAGGRQDRQLRRLLALVWDGRPLPAWRDRPPVNNDRSQRKVALPSPAGKIEGRERG